MVHEGRTLKQRAYQEFKEFLLLSLYLWVFLGMFTAFKSIVLSEHHIEFAPHGVALINALVLAKFMLIAKALHGKQFDEAPLIYPTLLKSAISALVLMVLKIFEDVAVGYFHGKSFTESFADLGGGDWKTILVFTGILFVVLTPLTAFGELQRVLGAGHLHDLFMRRRNPSTPLSQQAI